MKRAVYAFVLGFGLILGVLGETNGLFFPLMLIGIISAGLILLNDYEKGTYIIGSYAILDFFIREIVKSATLGSLWDELLFVFLVLLWIYKWFVHRRDKRYKWTPLEAPLIIFFGFSIFHLIVNSPDVVISIEGFRAVIQYMLWYFLVVQLLKTKKGAKRLYLIILFTGIILGFHGVYQYIIGVEMPSNWVDSVEKGIRTRVFSIIGSPNILGSIMTLTIPMGLSLVYAERKYLKKIFFAISTIAMTGCLVFTFSRGAWIGFIVAMVIFVLLKDKRLIIPGIVFIIIIIIFVPSVTDRMAYMMSEHYISRSLEGGRLIRWLTGIEMLKESPLLGVGLGHFGGAVAMNNNIPGTFYMDNFYLKTAVEMGILGLLAYFYLMYQVVIWSYRTLIILEDKYLKNIIIGALSGMTGVLAHNFVENVFEVPMMVTYFWILAGIIMFLRHRKIHEDISC
ncbi:MAG: polymerase [Firmicutes bacterium]|nr:polymerase [Bacillota bacterium]